MRKLFYIIFLLSSSILNAQYTPIPDSNFEQYLIDHGLDPDNTINGQVLTSAIDTVKLLDLNSSHAPFISDLSGIEDFIALERLDISGQLIDTLHLNGNLRLKSLNAFACLLMYLDLSRNDSLQYLNLFYAGSSQMSSRVLLDITHLHQLDTLITGSNFYDILDLTHNTRLRFLIYSNTNFNDRVGFYNQLDTLDLSANTLLEHLELNFIPIAHLILPPAPNLTWLELADQDFTSINLASYPQLQHLSLLHNTQLTSIDISNNTNLRYLNVNKCRLTGIDVTHNPMLEDLILGRWWSWGSIPHDEENNQFSTPPDLSANPRLRRLFVEGIGIDALDISANPNLQVIYANHNNLTQLDLSANTSLRTLFVRGNPLDSLDLRAQTQLRSLRCDSTTLSFLDLRNGNNQNMIEFSAFANPYLECIFVDDADWSRTNWQNIDSSVQFVETEDECLQVNVSELPNDWMFYPNPVHTTLHMVLPQQFDVIQTEIYNITGQQVSIQKGLEISFEGFKPGIYFAHIYVDNKSYIIKVIKEE